MEIKTITDRITCIVATLPNNPLKSLNAYIVRGDRRNMLIDTGFHLDETFSDLKEGIRELGVDMARTDIFLTHCHADHTGNAGRIASESSTIYASAIDKELIDSFISDNEGLKQYMTGQMSRLGFPESKNASSLSKNPSVKNNEPDVFAISAVEESHIFDLGGVRLRCIYTPGHTPGHMCL
ncbi:MAG: MBL fold metallo-hydrolase, partial [Clostridiales Family XIII bacterium]|nr:MBL fold metallo-hydrolase [Clostridiales Family XIII bacterium]